MEETPFLFLLERKVLHISLNFGIIGEIKQ